MRMAFLSKSMLFPLITIIAFSAVPCSNGLGPSPKQPSSLVPSSTQLQYHHGPLLTGPTSINIYLIWYGAFSPSHKLTISDFFASFNHLAKPASISTWWRTTQAYKDTARKPVSATIRLARQVSNTIVVNNLKRADIAALVKNAIAKRVFPFDSNGIYLVLTSSDIAVERFCMGSCGFHNATLVSPNRKAVFAHVGDPSSQCPGLCAWPFAVPLYGPPGPALVAPNSVGIDGMIMNIATVLAGAATNPFKNGYFQGDALAPLEAVTACAGIFGAGAYPGYPGKLMVDPKSKASYNAYGINRRRFLVPAMWDPLSVTCKVVA
ncbi:protein EXORDIUM-like 2 [Magnolia sinica]|uniref:protein EXORDIUM-like 2 n=1 Tax=Magnolia sinica TaxID=86752 RepID=UPI00265A8832|nr:protein EXORDIUM-like 2 [Magnolia sinica]